MDSVKLRLRPVRTEQKAKHMIMLGLLVTQMLLLSSCADDADDGDESGIEG
jgi:hypothetical protein